jgi:hypothetical protein
VGREALKRFSENRSSSIGVLPSGLCHLRRKRFQPTLRRMGIPFRNAHNGWRKNGIYSYPKPDGVLIAVEDRLMVDDYLSCHGQKGALTSGDYRVCSETGMTLDEYKQLPRKRRQELRKFIRSVGLG